MKYSVEVDINSSIERVMELFDNVENLYQWQPGLQSFDHVSGEVGQVGAVSKMVYSMGKREYPMTETIKSKNLPDEFTAIYEGPGMWNKAENQFIKLTETTCRWVATHEFKGQSIMMKLMLFFTPGAFKKETLKFMNYFKNRIRTGALFGRQIKLSISP